MENAVLLNQLCSLASFLPLDLSTLKHPHLPECSGTFFLSFCLKWLGRSEGLAELFLLYSPETGLIKETDRCLAVFPLMDGAFITLHASPLDAEAVMNARESEYCLGLVVIDGFCCTRQGLFAAPLLRTPTMAKRLAPPQQKRRRESFSRSCCYLLRLPAAAMQELRREGKTHGGLCFCLSQ